MPLRLEGGADLAGGETGAVHQGAIVAADEVVGVALTRPPGDDSSRWRSAGGIGYRASRHAENGDGKRQKLSGKVSIKSLHSILDSGYPGNSRKEGTALCG